MSTRLRLLGAWAALFALTLAAGVLLAQQQQSTRRSLVARFDARAPQAASFVNTFTSDLLRREAAIGTRGLTAADPAAEFAEDITAFDFSAAVLLDDHGRALAVFPANPKIIGVDLSAKYVHLRSGVAGHPTVSDEVGAAANGSPVVGFAAPFDTTHGRRVFSGAFTVGSTPLGSYLDELLVTPGARAFLVDGEDHVLAGNRPVRAEVGREPQAHSAPTLSGLDTALAEALGAHRMGGYSHAGHHAEFASAPVKGSRWTLVIAAQSRAVLAGTGGSGRWVPWLFLLGLSCSSAAALLVTARVNLRRRQLTELNGVLDLAANTDALTGLASRRLALSRLGHVISTGTCAVLLSDIDHFKGVNDSHGHAAGDGVLMCVAGALRSSLRSGDTLSRWGGDEFLAIMPATSLSAAEEIACRSLDRVRALSSRSSGIPRVTVSIGCAATVPSHIPSAIGELLLRADQALYRAKAAGRSTVHTSAV